MFSFRAKDKDKRTGIDGRWDTKKKQDEIEINRISGSWRSGAGEGERLLLLHQTRRSGAFKGHDGSCIFTTLYYVMFRVQYYCYYSLFESFCGKESTFMNYVWRFIWELSVTGAFTKRICLTESLEQQD